ncbi:MAG: hypothetical protein ACNA74_08510 [Desulfurivibrio sp.]
MTISRSSSITACRKKSADKHIGQTMLEEGFLDSEALVDLFRDQA